MKYLLILFLLVGCGSEIEEKRKDANTIRELVKKTCKCHGGYTYINYIPDIRFFERGYSSAIFGCSDLDGKFMVYIDSDVSDRGCN